MKKIKWLTTLLVVATLFAVIGCNNPSGPGDDVSTVVPE